MELFLKILGLLISLTFIYIGLRFCFKPKKAIQSIQRIKYKATSEPRKVEVRVSVAFGVILTLIGIYYLTIVILSIIYPV